MKDLFGDTPAIPASNPEAELHKVMLAMALLWMPQPRTTIYTLLRKLDFKHSSGRLITADEVKHCIQQLVAKKLVVESKQRAGYYRLADAQRNPLYEELLDTVEAHLLRRALYEVAGYNPLYALYSWPLYDREATIAVVRLTLLTQAPQAEIERMAQLIGRTMDWNDILHLALLQDFSAAFFARIDPALRWELAYLAVQDMTGYWDVDLLPIVDWTLAQLGCSRAQMPSYLRIAIAELWLHRGERDAAREALEGITESAVEALQAYALAQQGKWAEAQALFETALKKRQVEIKAKKRVFPASIAWIYPLTLLAQQTPAHLELARKFCIGESGKRDPDTTSGWGQWVHAIDVRRGDAEPDPDLYRAAEYYSTHVSLDHLWRVLLAAWLGTDARRGAKQSYRDALSVMAQHQLDRLQQCGFNWLAHLALGAKNLIDGAEPPAGYFVAGKTEHWRELLSALQSLGGDAPAKSESGETTRLVWVIDIGKDGALQDIQPMEQKRGARGWSKPKAVALSRISGNPKLAPWDAKVANCIRTEKYGRRTAVLDLPQAIQALVGHPAVALSGKPEQAIELSEGTPEIEVIHKADKITLKVTPPLRVSATADKYYHDADEKREAEALRLITLVQDSAQRVRLIRFTPSQRRAAQLLAKTVAIPVSAQKELQTAMQALTSHFQLQADHLQAAREVKSEPRLRAELSPLNDGLLLRLVATPLGESGPRLVPGSGRARLMAAVGGENIGTTRQLDVERAHLDAVLDALPFLENCAGDSGQCEWEVAEPEDALALVEVLPALPGIAALGWPKGKAVKVIPVDMPQLSVQVKSERDWFKIEGEAKSDEGMVFTFETLLAAATGNSRFIAMGNGVYAALTRRLKDRLSDLASVAEAGKHGARIPRLAAAWMDDALEGITTQADQEFHGAIEKLRATQQQAIPLPKTLQAELRPYQEDGYLWASRLAQAGFGACLADDMGLGKTLQSLALLLARAADGPALIIAPTSVCGNWIAEAARFAPSLNMHLYSEADREAVIEAAAAFDVVVVSYNLVQLAGEQFAAKHWHTLIADEAQAIKNATAKRSQAVFELHADFRLALSGTPVENRLAELWSIMRFANPGLLGSLTRFNERFAVPIERDKDRDAQHTLRRLISPFLLRRTKTQVLQELPPRTELLIKIAPSQEEASHYEALRRQAMAEADAALASGKAGQARMNILAQLTRLRRAACDPRIVTQAYPASGSKVQTFTTLAIELVANGHKALVFSQFVDFLALLREALDAAGIAYQYLDGATPAAERTKRVNAFQTGNSDLFLISLKAGGFGLNLTAADYVVITDPWWNPAAEDQAMGRAHRMGQLRPVTVYRLVTQGTVEEHIVGLHNDKRALAESILGEGDAVNIPSTEELISLIKGD
ncbi:MAG: DEAD/DEAH box helicase [Nitrosomonadales bacterium]|nr:DEAD/DEAH box helicase [Nitrosomonadales bacterium]